MLGAFCRATDSGDFAAWVDLFTPDGCFEMTGQVHTGRDQLLRFIEQDQPPEKRGLHLSVNPWVTVNGSTGRARSDFLFVAMTGTGPAIIATGAYLDDVARTADGRWQFSRREALISMLHPATKSDEFGNPGAAG
ncbi:MAG: nuclear transport factor 2 family protein [Acidimicrobiales bacterium]